MTAEMSLSPGRPPTDAELAIAAARGDRRAFALIYDRYADRLHDYCVGMMHDRDAAADCVQDAFCTAADALGGLRDPDKLRPWLYSIARSKVLHHIRDHRRETLVAEHFDSSSDEPGPDTMAGRDELATLVAEAAGGLSERDQQVLDLTYRHGLDGAELAQVLGVSQTNANTMVHRLRDTVERSLGALLVSRRVRNTGGCQELATILAGWDGHFNVLMRKRISRHIEACDVCDDERRRLVTPAALLGGAPVFLPAPDWLREATLRDVQLVSHNTSTATGAQRGERSSWLPVSLFAAALVAVIGVSALWLTRDDPVLPVDDSTTLPQSTTLPPLAPASPPPASVAPAPTSTRRAVTTAATTPVWTPAPTPTPVIPEPAPPAPQPEPSPPPAPEPEVPPVPPVIVDPPPPFDPGRLPGVTDPTPPNPRPGGSDPTGLAPIPATLVVPPPQSPAP